MNQSFAAGVSLPASRYWTFFGISILGCAIDLATKSWSFERLGFPGGPSHWLADRVLGFTTSLNEGALFGVGQGMTFVFAGLSVAAAVGIVYWLFFRGAAHDALLNFALGCVMAGIGGNLYDRLGLHGLKWPIGPRQGQQIYAVRDWIHFRIEGVIDWPIFNIADSLLVCGAGLLVWHAFRAEEKPAPAAPLQKPPA